MKLQIMLGDKKRETARFMSGVRLTPKRFGDTATMPRIHMPANGSWASLPVKTTFPTRGWLSMKKRLKAMSESER